MNIVVIGGGVIGLTTAYWLMQDGRAVTVLERCSELAAEGSFSNGGMLHASHGEPWNSPQAIRQLLAWIGREGSPLLLRPAHLPRMLRWGSAFLRNSTAARHRAALLANTRLARYSLARMADIRAATDIRYDAAQAGIAKIFWDVNEWQAAVRDAEQLQAHGLSFVPWSRAELLAREPLLDAVGEHLAGAVFYPDDETGDTCLFTRQLGAYCQQQGVAIRTDAPVRALELTAGRQLTVVMDNERLQPDLVVLATGAEAARLVRPLGLRLPVEPVKGYSLTLDVGAMEQRLRLPLIDDHHKIVATPLGERLRVAGTAEFTGFDSRINAARIQLLRKQLTTLLPQYAQAFAQAATTEWACLRPMTPDGVPIIGPSPISNLWFNVGAGHMGWTLAAGAGRLLADMIAARPLGTDAAAFALDRFR